MLSRPELVPDAIPAFAARFRTAGVAGLATALPKRVVGNQEIGVGIDVDAAWIERRTGIRRRRWVGHGENVVTLAAEAASGALLASGVPADRVDLVLVATLAPDELTPNAAPKVASAIGAHAAGAIDVGAACTGFVSALGLGASMIEAGRAEHVLVIGAEVLSRFTDIHDRRTAGLFGDGAGAALLAAGTAGRIGPVVFGADGAAAGLICADRREQLLRMDGHETFKLATASLVTCTRAAVELVGLELADVDLFVFHQANGRILSSVGDSLGVDRDKVVDAIAEIGNTSSASIPLALAQAGRDGLLRPGAQVLLAAVGAGFTWGATVVEWGRA